MIVRVTSSNQFVVLKMTASTIMVRANTTFSAGSSVPWKYAVIGAVTAGRSPCNGAGACFTLTPARVISEIINAMYWATMSLRTGFPTLSWSDQAGATPKALS